MLEHRRNPHGILPPLTQEERAARDKADLEQAQRELRCVFDEAPPQPPQPPPQQPQPQPQTQRPQTPLQTPPRTPQSAATAAARARLAGGGDGSRATFDRNKGRAASAARGQVVSPDLRLVDVDGGGADHLAASTSPVVSGLWRQALNRTAAIRHLRSVLDDKGKGENDEEKCNEGEEEEEEEEEDDDDDDQAIMRHLRRNMARDADGRPPPPPPSDGTRIPHRLSPRHLRHGGPGSVDSAGYDDEEDMGSGRAPLASLQSLRAELFESQALAAAVRNREAARRRDEVARHIPLSYRGKSLNRRASEGSCFSGVASYCQA